MTQKKPLKAKILDFNLATHLEICQELGRRLRLKRLLKRLKQTELALRAGVSVGTVKNLESKGQSSIESLVRVVVALDLVNDLSLLFGSKLQSIAEVEQMERLVSKSIPRRVR